MENIINYLVNERNQKPQVATKASSSFERHEDIRAELEKWIEQREFTHDNPVMVEGYTAEAISKLAPFYGWGWSL